VVLCLGGDSRIVSGLVEFHGGHAGRFFTALPAPFRFGAITLGHVILAVSLAELAALRDHEHVHVRQYEKWGGFFLPAYALSSLWQVLHGRCGYRENFFERHAYAIDANKKVAASLLSRHTANCNTEPKPQSAIRKKQAHLPLKKFWGQHHSP
jgi:hypothetical protein